MLARKIALVALPFTFVAFASLDCGGKLDTSLLPVCPSDGTCSSDCKQVVTDCSGTYDLACNCVNGQAACPELGAPACQSDCNALMNNHQYTCSIEGERCPSPSQNSCLDAPELYCTCSGGQFACDVPPMNCPAPVCPSPDQVVSGASCAGFETCPTSQVAYDCQGNAVGYVECSCTNGVFGNCYGSTPPCAIDAGADAIFIDAEYKGTD